ncbi:MAG: hypothetical protein K5761_07955 [Clostridiales bacterium]|nr:hypothetical protein [Clostridiales bacterium]
MTARKRIISLIITMAIVFTALPLTVIESFALATPAVSLSNVASGVKISWSAVSSAKGYYVYRKSGSDGFKSIKTVTTTNYTDTSAKSGTKYTYAVKAYNGKTKSGYKEKSILFIDDPAITVTNSTKGTVIKWKAISGAKGYYIYRKTGSGSYSVIKTQTGTDYTDTSVKSGTTYTYAVRAYNGSTKSAYTAKTNMFLAYPVVTVANAKAGVSVSWAKISGAKGYHVYRKTADGSYTKIASVTGISYIDKTAVSGTQYTYCARAYNGNYIGSYAGKTLIRLAEPNVILTNDSPGVIINWADIKGAEGYYIYRKKAGGGYSRIGQTTRGTYTDKTAVSGTKYTYCAKSFSGKSYSSYTGKDILYLSTPQSSLTTLNNGVRLTWTAVSGAEGYYVFRKTDSGSFVQIATVSARSYKDETIVFGASTQYRVYAYKGTYKSGYNTISTVYKTNDNQRFEKQMLDAVNAYRESAGATPDLEWNDEIAAYAGVRSAELKELYDHDRPNGEYWDDHIFDNYTECNIAGEIIYKTPTPASPNTILSILKNNAAERDKLLDMAYSDFGASIYLDEETGYYYICIILYGEESPFEPSF